MHSLNVKELVYSYIMSLSFDDFDKFMFYQTSSCVNVPLNDDSNLFYAITTLNFIFIFSIFTLPSPILSIHHGDKSKKC
jgi:hypothetical protein